MISFLSRLGEVRRVLAVAAVLASTFWVAPLFANAQAYSCVNNS